MGAIIPSIPPFGTFPLVSAPLPNLFQNDATNPWDFNRFPVYPLAYTPNAMEKPYGALDAASINPLTYNSAYTNIINNGVTYYVDATNGSSIPGAGTIDTF